MKISIKIVSQKFLKILRFNSGEWDLNPRTSCSVAGFQDQCFQPLSHLSLYMNTLFFTTKATTTINKYAISNAS